VRLSDALARPLSRQLPARQTQSGCVPASVYLAQQSLAHVTQYSRGTSVFAWGMPRRPLSFDKPIPESETKTL